MAMERQWPALPEPTPESLSRWAAEITRLLRTGEIANAAAIASQFLTPAAADALFLTPAEGDALFLTPAEGNAAYQPLDSDLTAIAALTTTAFGRSLLAQADAAAALATLTAAGQGKQSLWVPVDMMNVIAALSPPAVQTPSYASGIATYSLGFDSTTEEFAYFNLAMPKGWNNGSISFKAYWTHASTTVNFGVSWRLLIASLSDDDSLNASFGYDQSVSDTGGTTDDVYISAESTAATPTGAANSDILTCRASRNPLAAADTMAIDARLLGYMVHYTTNAATDA